MFVRVASRSEWQFFALLPQADRMLAAMWWLILVLRGLLPVAFAIAMGVLVGAVQGEDALEGPLALVGVVFVLLQTLQPVHQAVSANLGNRTSAWLNDELARSAVAPPGMGHLENPALTNDLTMARDFDLGISGPPLSLAMDFIAAGMVQMVAGLASAIILVGFAWWAPLVLAAGWLATHWLLRESAIWRDRNTEEVREAQRHADYTYRLAVDPPAAKELRMFGLGAWTVQRFRSRRTRLYELRWEATRLRERSVGVSLFVVLAASTFFFWMLADAAADGALPLDRVVVFAISAMGTSAIAFGGLSWAVDGAAAPTAAVLRLRESMAEAGALPSGGRIPVRGTAHEVRFRDVSFAYPATGELVLRDLDLTIPAGSSMAIVGQNGAGKTTLAKLLCRLYDPQQGAIEVDGTDLREFDIEAWREEVTAVFQDFVRFELPLRDNVVPGGRVRGASDELVRSALDEAGASGLADLDTILHRGYPGGTELSGGQWQRVALARALAAVKLGAGVVILDEPTAQLDVRGEAEIFNRILAATRHTTTILISHRFSTVRHADRICVVEGGRVVELGTHGELMAARGRYRTMFDLQASRFADAEDDSLDSLDGVAEGAGDGIA